MLDEVTLELGNGKKINILYKNNSSENIYIQGITFNGKEYTKSYVFYEDLGWLQSLNLKVFSFNL